MHNSSPGSLYKENQKIVILISTVLFHLILIFRENLTSLFEVKETGFFFLTIVIIFLFSIMFFSEKFAIINSKTINFTAKWEMKKVVKLFLFFVIPISLFGILIRILVIQSVPIEAKLADMLPLIQKAGNAFLKGQNPYQVYYFPYAMPLTFWPGLWMPFLAATIFGFDPRWIGLGVWGIISLILILFTLQISIKQSSRLILLLSSINIFFLQISINFVSFHGIGHTFSLWLWLLLLGIGIIEKKNLLTAIALGLVLSSRQTSIIFVPILLVFWYRNLGWKTALKYLMISTAVFGSITLAFIIQSPINFFVLPIQHYQQLANYAMSLGTSGWTSNTLGFSYFIQRYLGAKTLSLISGLVVLSIAAATLYMTKKPTRLILFMAASVTIFSFFTPIPWTYEYYPALLFLSLAILS